MEMDFMPTNGHRSWDADLWGLISQKAVCDARLRIKPTMRQSGFVNTSRQRGLILTLLLVHHTRGSRVQMLLVGSCTMFSNGYSVPMTKEVSESILNRRTGLLPRDNLPAG